MIFAPLLVVVVIASGWWAWSYQQRAVRILRVRPSSAEHDARRTATASLRAGRSAVGADRATTGMAVQQLERVCSSVLGWDAFSIESTLVFDGTVLIACRRRRHPELPDGGAGDPAEDGSFVLLIGDDERADKAVALLEGWRAATTTLWLRPTRVAGAIELFDGRANALRAGLLAA